LRAGKDDSPDEHKKRLDSSLAHTFGDHSACATYMTCGERKGCRALVAAEDNEVYVPTYSGGVYPSKESKAFTVATAIWARLTTPVALAQCRHNYDTNSNEANNKSATSYEFPKSNCCQCAGCSCVALL
jgi:hypothetical protein